MGDPIEPSGPDLDDLTRAEDAELDGLAVTVAHVLDDWIARKHGILSSDHYAR